MKLKKYLIIAITLAIVAVGGFVFLAFAKTWGKTDIEFKVHINEELVQQSTFGESPTFAIWLENPKTQKTQTIFVTKRAALGDWEGKANVPVALPKWFEVYKAENQADDIPTLEKPAPLAISGATPKPGYFMTRVRVKPGSTWNCFIEVNLAGDFNEHYKEYNEVEKTTDEFLTGQPALIYKAEIVANIGNSTIPEIVGMCIMNAENGKIIQPAKGITTAKDVFDEINISVIKPKPRIIEWN